MKKSYYDADEIKKIWEDFFENFNMFASSEDAVKANPVMAAKMIEKLYIMTSMADEINHMYDDGDSLEV